MTDRVMMILKQLQNEQLSARLRYGDYWDNPLNLVFTSDKGSQMSSGTPYKFLTKFLKLYNIKRVNVHSMRHINHMKTSL